MVVLWRKGVPLRDGDFMTTNSTSVDSRPFSGRAWFKTAIECLVVRNSQKPSIPVEGHKQSPWIMDAYLCKDVVEAALQKG
jgi:hypothetical protein